MEYWLFAVVQSSLWFRHHHPLVLLLKEMELRLIQSFALHVEALDPMVVRVDNVESPRMIRTYTGWLIQPILF